MTHRIVQAVAAGFLPLVLVGACDAGGAWSPYAGLSIEGLDRTSVIESKPRSSAENIGWVSSPQPQLRIGVVEGDAPYRFSGIAGVIRLGDGRILVADGGTAEVRLFSPDGQHLRSVGGTGQGPGEFQQILWMKPFGSERLLIWDGLLRRGSVFTTEGEYVQSVPLPEIPEHPLLFPENAFIDGSILTQAGPPRDTIDEAGRQWKVVSVHRTQLIPASTAVRVGDFPSHLPQAEDVWPKWQVGGDILAYTRGDVSEVLVIDPAQGAPRVIREGKAADRKEAELTTYFGELQIDDRGRVWARRHDSDLWVVFDSSGETYSEFHQPGGVQVHQISDGQLIGVERSELGVESVVVYELQAL